MSKKQVKATLKLQIPGGAATPAPPVGAALGQQQVNIMDFCKKFNAATADKKGQVCPVLITVYTDKTFDFVVKTPPTSDLIKKAAGISKGVSDHKSQKAGKLTWRQVEEIAAIKMPDLNAVDLEGAKRIVAGSALSMGIEVV